MPVRRGSTATATSRRPSSSSSSPARPAPTITVWGQERSPRTQYVEYYAELLNKIGYKATPKLIADTTYFPTIGNAKTNAQTGFADWIQDFPNPSDFYLLLDAQSIQPVNNENFGNVNDPNIQ